MAKNNKKWGIMVYMAADNDLTEEAIQAIGRIKKSFEDCGERLKDVEFFLYFDGNAFGFPGLQFDFSEPASANNPIELGEFKASPESIFRFVEACSKKGGFGSIENYALIVSSHGYGFQEDSLLKDETSDTSATVQKLASEIAGLDTLFLGKRLKILGFDSCVMNSLEVAYEISEAIGKRREIPSSELKDLFMVSSEGYVPLTGWNYSQIIEDIANNKDLSPQKMAKLLVDCYIHEYEPNGKYSGVSLDAAAISLGIVDNVTQKLFGVAKELRDRIRTGNDSFQLTKTLLGTHSRCQTFLFDQCVDIKDFSDLLLKELTDEKFITEDSTTYRSLVDISGIFVSEAVYCRSLGIESRYANGLSLFFPWSFDSFVIVLARYRELKFGHQTDDKKALSEWGDFLWHYLYGTMRDDKSYENGTELFETGLKDGLCNLFGDPVKHAAVVSEIVTKHINVNSFFGVVGENKVNPPDNVRINPPDNSRINPPDKTRLGNRFVENFRRTHNIRWLPEPARKKLMGNLDEHGTREIRENAAGTNR